MNTDKMRAIISPQYGTPDVLQIKEVDRPRPKDNEILIKVYATTANRTDYATLRAKPYFARLFTGLTKPKKNILGTDFAGQIEAIGNQVKSFKVGDKVFGLDDSGMAGSHAQYMTISEDKGLAGIPDNITYAQAAACLEGAHYAYNFINKLDLKSGQRILVIGATGSIGSAAVQLLKYFEIKVTAVCKGKDRGLVKSLGAEKVIDYTQEDFTKYDVKYNYIFDTVGKSSFGICKSLLALKGVYASSELGSGGQNIFLALLTPLFGKKKVIFPMPQDCKASVLLVKKLLEEGSFQAVIDREYPMEEIADALIYVGKGQKTGNVVVNMTHDN